MKTDRVHRMCVKAPLSFDGKELEGLGRDHINYHPVMVGKMMVHQIFIIKRIPLLHLQFLTWGSESLEVSFSM